VPTTKVSNSYWQEFNWLYARAIAEMGAGGRFSTTEKQKTLFFDV